MKKIKVAVLTAGRGVYGVEKVILSHCQALQAADYGIDFQYICLERGQLYERLLECGGDVRVIGGRVPGAYSRNPFKLFCIFFSSFWTNVEVYRKIKAYLKESRPDLVYTHDVTLHILGGAAARSCSIKSVGHFHRIVNRDRNWGLSRVLLSLALNVCLDMGIAISKAVRESLWGAMRFKTRCVYNSIDVEAIRERAEALGRRRDCVRTDVVSVGRMVSIKKYEIVMEALSILVKNGLNLKLAIVGGPADESNAYYLRLKEQAETLGLSDAVAFTGYVREPYGIVANSDASVLCCTNEGFGLVVLESMACGTPVIVVDAGGLTELVQHGRDGLKFSVDNAEELAECLRVVITDKDRAQRMAERAYVKVAEGFSIESHMRCLKESFSCVLNRSLSEAGIEGQR